MNIIKNSTNNLDKAICGLIMPISEIENCDENHWHSVRKIIETSLKDYFECRMVSEADDTSFIHSSIVNNIYNNEIIICDVSCKNPNVLFELGLRLAFDKPTVIVKDNATNYTFDTGIIEHLVYPRDLNYPGIMKFIEDLKSKTIATYEASKKESYSMFLRHFPNYKVSKLQEKTVTENELITKRLASLEQLIMRLSDNIKSPLWKAKMDDASQFYKASRKRDIMNFIKQYAVENKKVYLELTKSEEIDNLCGLLLDEDFINPKRVTIDEVKDAIFTLISPAASD